MSKPGKSKTIHPAEPLAPQIGATESPVLDAALRPDPQPASELHEKVVNRSANVTGSGGAAGSPSGKGQGGLAGSYPNQGAKGGVHPRPNSTRHR